MWVIQNSVLHEVAGHQDWPMEKLKICHTFKLNIVWKNIELPMSRDCFIPFWITKVIDIVLLFEN